MVVPAGGLSLLALGLTHGPVDRVFLPRSAFVSARIDQVNNVAVVLRYPSAAALAAFLRRMLPVDGFVLTATNEVGTTLTFAGFGWIGTFTGSDEASALLLRPAS